MKKTLPVLAALAAVALQGATSPVGAQTAADWWRVGALHVSADGVRYEADGDGGWWWERDREARDRQDDDDGWRADDRDDDGRRRGNARAERGKAKGRAQGPAFCRSGAGHPVHGRAWCARKGGSWGEYGRYGDRWERAGWTDVVLGAPQPTRDRRIAEPTLADVLGDVVFGRLVEQGEGRGLRGDMEGRWVPVGERGSLLQLRMGGVPLAELTDVDRDGRVDVVLLSRRN